MAASSKQTRGLTLFIALTVLLALVIILEVLRYVDGLQGVNVYVLNALPYARTPAMEVLSGSASLEAFALLALIIYVMDASLDGRVSEPVASFIVALILSMILTALIKAYVAAPRPHEPSAYFGLLGNLINADYFAFPSGHTVRVTVLSYYVLSVFPQSRRKKVSYLVLIYAGAVMVSRLLLQVHWLSDIIGGIIVGLWSSYVTEGLGRPAWRLIYDETLGRVPFLRIKAH
ncbi:MAG: phosphatase PAP2 family protein [Acidilobus sp.]|nr:phosphatase PAP2 family protein [Acidilobus sp.]MCG2891261.1 phosphatase PAP2 family protein [Acidilobus sp.]